ncbi:hypothetical protein OAF54_03250 [bacterium]|nr:hypothetical protein [bacterium]
MTITSPLNQEIPTSEIEFVTRSLNLRKRDKAYLLELYNRHSVNPMFASQVIATAIKELTLMWTLKA